MSDTQPTGANDDGQDENQQGAQSPLIVNGQYIKDLSFECPNSPSILADLQSGKQPELNVNVNVTTAPLTGPQTPAGMHEVVLELNAEMKLDGKVAYLAELKYAGVFTINVPEEHVKPFSLVECPRILLPYARQILSSTTQSGGFMPLMLQPIDFMDMYQRGLAAQQQGDAAPN